MFILVLRKGFYMHFPGLLPNPEDQEMFGGCFTFFCFGLLCLFAYLLYMDKWNVFCHTNICSLSCPGPGDSSRVLTMQAHTGLEGFAAPWLCIIPWCISAGTWQFSRCYQGLQTGYWEEQLAACVSQKQPGPAWCSCCSERRRLSPGWGEEGALAFWRCWVIIPVLPA